jgi:hypothetical protein
MDTVNALSTDLDETVTWIREAKHDFPTRYAVAASTAERINNFRKATHQPRIPRRNSREKEWYWKSSLWLSQRQVDC